MTNSINDLSEVIRLTHENLEQTKRLTSIPSYMTGGSTCDQQWSDHHGQ